MLERGLKLNVNVDGTAEIFSEATSCCGCRVFPETKLHTRVDIFFCQHCFVVKNEQEVETKTGLKSKICFRFVLFVLSSVVQMTEFR